MIRYAQAQDTDRVRALWEQGFGDEEPYTGWYFREVYQSELTLLYEKEGRLCSSLQLAPYTVSLRGQALAAAYIVGVVTDKSERGRGYASRLLRRALEDMQGKGQKLALLYTDIPEFYRPLGFTCCYELRHLRFKAKRGPLPPSATSAAPATSATSAASATPAAPATSAAPVSPVRPVAPTAEALARCQRIYGRMCQDLDGYVQRTGRNWLTYVSDWLSDSRNGLYLGDEFYFLTDISEAGFLIKELGYTGAVGLKQALDCCAALAAHRGYAEFFWDGPKNSPLPPQPEESPRPWVMARVTGRTELTAEDAAYATRRLLDAPRSELWIGEMT